MRTAQRLGEQHQQSAVSVQPEKPFLAVTLCHFLEQKGPTTVAPCSLVRLYPQKNQVAYHGFVLASPYLPASTAVTGPPRDFCLTFKTSMPAPSTRPRRDGMMGSLSPGTSILHPNSQKLPAPTVWEAQDFPQMPLSTVTGCSVYMKAGFSDASCLSPM